MLEQNHNGVWHPLGFFSRKLSAAEVKYSTYDRELLAAYLSTRHFIHTIEGRLTTLRTDHKPLTHIFTHKTEKYVDRQVRQISFLSQYINIVEYVNGPLNVVPDALSRMEISALQNRLPDAQQWFKDQENDEDLRIILSGVVKCSLQIRVQDTPSRKVYADFPTGSIRTYVPTIHRLNVFEALYGMAHGGRKATQHGIRTRYCWPKMNADIAKWSKCCLQCQRTKVGRHTVSPITSYAPSDRRFGHVHLDIVGPLSLSNNNKYLDATPQWSLKLPVVLLALRSTVKVDIGLAPTELVYGTTLRLPGELFHPATSAAQPSELIRALRQTMSKLRPTPGTNHASRRLIFVPEQLSQVSHVFLRIGAAQPPLLPKYEGPYAVLEWQEKVFKIQHNNRTAWVSIDRLKLAFVLREDPLADHTYVAQPVEVIQTRKKLVCFYFPEEE